MSLINEALRKARKEAAERDAEERGVSYRPPRAHLPAERSWLPALAGVALGAVLAAAAFFFLMPRGATDEASEPAQAPTVAEAAVPPKPTAPPMPAAPAATTPDPDPTVPTEPEPVAETPPEPAPAATAATAAASEPPAVATDTEPETRETPPVESVEPAEDALPKTQTEEPSPAPATRDDEVQRVRAPDQVGQVDEAEYVLEATVDGVALRLDFIVWGANPFAQINGRQVSVGQSVEGFLVRDIAREKVILEGESGPFTLHIR